MIRNILIVALLILCPAYSYGFTEETTPEGDEIIALVGENEILTSATLLDADNHTLDTDNFNGNLGVGDTDTQTALETLDDLSLGTGTVSAGVANALSRYPGSGDTVDDSSLLFTDEVNGYFGIGVASPAHAIDIHNIVTDVYGTNDTSVLSFTAGTAVGSHYNPLIETSASGGVEIGVWNRPRFKPLVNIAEVRGENMQAILAESAFDITRVIDFKIATKTEATYTGTVTNSYGLNIGGPVYLGAIPENRYSIYIENQSASVSEYPIYSVHDHYSYFIAGIEIGGVARTAPNLRLGTDGDVEAKTVTLENITSAVQGTATLTLGNTAADYAYSNGSSTATYTIEFDEPLTGQVTYATATFGGESGVITLTWTGCDDWIGDTGATTTTSSLKSMYAFKIINGNTECKIVEEGY